MKTVVVVGNTKAIWGCLIIHYNGIIRHASTIMSVIYAVAPEKCLSLDDGSAFVDELSPPPPPSFPEDCQLTQTYKRLVGCGAIADNIKINTQSVNWEICAELSQFCTTQVITDDDIDVGAFVECGGLPPGDQLLQPFDCIQVVQHPTVEKGSLDPFLNADSSALEEDEHNGSNKYVFYPHSHSLYVEGINYEDMIALALDRACDDVTERLSGPLWCESESKKKDGADATVVSKRKRSFVDSKKLRRKNAGKQEPVCRPPRFTRSAFKISQDDFRHSLPTRTTRSTPKASQATPGSVTTPEGVGLRNVSVDLGLRCCRYPPKGFAVQITNRASDDQPRNKRSRNDCYDINFVNLNAKKDTHCVKCNGSWNASLPRVKWVRCISCKLWCHEDCADGDLDYFTCLMCQF